jgi:hypothetical protein
VAARARCAARGHGRTRALIRAALAALLLSAGAATAHAGAASGRFCDAPSALSATQQDRLLSFAAIAKRELEASGQRVAIVARSGLDLARFRIRYSHAGLSLAAHPNGPWSVRQLYYACDEGQPRLYDQGLAGFLYGTNDPELGYLSIVLLPAPAADSLERAALDTPRALALLGGSYSANAYAFSTRYQNCNQWLIELLAGAWGAGVGGRDAAQRWLAERGYAPQPVEVNSRALMFAAGFVPWLRTDDHPSDDLQAMRFRTSLPAAIEAFVHAREPGAERIELCHDGEQVVIRRGWTPIADGCVPAVGDRVIAFDSITASAPAR